MNPAAQIFIGLPGPELDAASAALLAAHPPGGVVLGERNIANEAQLSRLVTALRRLLPEAVLATEAEGGRVDHLEDLVGPAPAPALLARHAPSFAFKAGHWIAQSLGLFDIAMDFAPVVDLDRGALGNELAGRYFGATASDVVPRAQGFLRGLQSGGVGGCLKHFPGLGGAGEGISGKATVVNLPAEVLERGLEPFHFLARLAGAVLVNHAVYPAWDAQRPASLSPEILGGLLRGRLGYGGLVFSEGMEQSALDAWGGLAERCELALAAGCDVLLLRDKLEALPEIAARLARPSLEPRLIEAGRRLEVYRQRLATLRAAREHVAFLRDNTRGERLGRVRQALEQLQMSA